MPHWFPPPDRAPSPSPLLRLPSLPCRARRGPRRTPREWPAPMSGGRPPHLLQHSATRSPLVVPAAPRRPVWA